MSGEIERVNGHQAPAMWMAPDALQCRHNAAIQAGPPVPVHVWVLIFGLLTGALTAIGCIALLLGALTIGIVIGGACVLALAIVGGLIVERREGRPFGAQR